MLKFAFKDLSTKNSEPTYWTILFVMLKIYFIYKTAGKKIQNGYIKFNYVICLSDTGSSCHGVTDRTCKQKSWLKCACFLYKIHVTLQCIVVFEKWSFSNILLFYLDVVWFGGVRPIIRQSDSPIVRRSDSPTNALFLWKLTL